MAVGYINLLPSEATFLKLSMPILYQKVHEVSLDLSKGFDRVYHNGLLYKLKSNGIDGNLFKLVKLFLNNRHRRFAFNGQWLDQKLVKVQFQVHGFSHLH